MLKKKKPQGWKKITHITALLKKKICISKVRYNILRSHTLLLSSDLISRGDCYEQI